MTYLFSNGTVITNEVEVKNDVGNPLPVTGNVTVTSITGGASSVTAFGEPYAVTITPVIQLDSIYGITTEVIQTYLNGTGADANASPSQGLYTISSGTSLGGYGVLRSKRFMRYRPGQGALARFTAAFTPNVANSYQVVGLANEENAIQLGWNQSNTGPKFGVLRATGGKAEIRQLTINSITTGSQTLTVTLNGVAFTVTVNTASTQDAAVAIANRVGGYNGWLIDQVDNTIVFLGSSVGARAGTYSLTGSGTVSGTFTQRQAGVAQTENWTYQGNFTEDNLDGTGPSGMILRSQYLNVYQINFRWLGAGEIRYAIENDSNGNMIFFHKEHYTNKNSLPHTAQPSFKIAYTSYNLGGASSAANVYGASMMAAIEGDIRQNELNRSTSVSKSSIAQNTLAHLLTLRNPYVTNGVAGALNGNFVLNAKEILLKDISVAVQGTDPALLYIFFEPTSFSGTHSYFSQPKDNGMISTADGTLNSATDTPVCQFVIGINAEAQYKLSDFRVAVPPGSYVSFAIKSTNQISRVTMALVFSED